MVKNKNKNKNKKNEKYRYVGLGTSLENSFVLYTGLPTLTENP